MTLILLCQIINKKSLSKTNLFERRPQKDAQLLFIGWKTSKNITIVHLNINLLRNKLEAMEDLIKKYSKIPLIRPSWTSPHPNIRPQICNPISIPNIIPHPYTRPHTPHPPTPIKSTKHQVYEILSSLRIIKFTKNVTLPQVFWCILLVQFIYYFTKLISAGTKCRTINNNPSRQLTDQSHWCPYF